MDAPELCVADAGEAGTYVDAVVFVDGADDSVTAAGRADGTYPPPYVGCL